MDIPKQGDTPPERDARVDKDKAEIVDRGIMFQQLYGTKVSAEYLKNKMVGIDVVLRVLGRRLERRGINSKKQYP